MATETEVGSQTNSLDSGKQQVKLWAKWSYETANLLVSMGYYFGSLPVYWNRQEHKMEVIKSRFDKIRWISTIVMISFVQMAILLAYAKDYFYAEDPMKFLLGNIVRGSYGLIAGFATLFHFHTAWKYREFVNFINLGANFYEFFQNKYATDAERKGVTFEDGLSGIIKFVFFIGMAGLSLMSTAFFLFKCNMHFMAPLLPICDQDYGVLSIWMYFGLMIAQVWFCQVIAASIILYIDLFAAVVLVGHYIACEMVDYTNRTRRTKRTLLNHEEWHRNYRSLHLIVLQLNDCIGEVFMPVHMLLITFLTGTIVFGLVQYSATLGVSFTIFCFLVLSLLGVYYIFLIGRGSSFSDELETAVSLRKLTLTTKYFVRLHRACAPIRPAVGVFFTLKGKTVGTMVSTSMEFAVDLLLM